LGLNLFDESERNKDDIEAGLNKLFTATSILFITIALILVVSALGCLLFCFHCFRRIQAVSIALLNANNMSSARAQAAEATLRKTRVLIMSTSAVVSVTLIMRATFQILYGSTFTAKYNASCSSQCNHSCQDDLFLQGLFRKCVSTVRVYVEVIALRRLQPFALRFSAPRAAKNS
jgi:hypothetical protein